MAVSGTHDRLVRTYAVLCAALFLPLAPLFFARVTTARRHPIEMTATSTVRQADGSVIVRNRDGELLKIESICIDAQPCFAAGSAEVGRQLRNLPAGTHVRYVTAGGSVRGTVEETAVPPSAVAAKSVQGVLAVAFVLCGLCLGIAGSGRAAMLAAGFLSGGGTMLAWVFIEPAVVLIRNASVRSVVIAILVAVPGSLWAWFLIRFASEFPTPLTRAAIGRALASVVFVCGAGRAVLLAWAQLPFAFDDVAWTVQLTVIRTLESGVLQNLAYLLAVVMTIVLILRQWRGYAASRRRDIDPRVRWVGLGIALGISPGVAAMLIQLTSVVTLERQVIPPLGMSLSFLPMLLVPATLGYALLARKVDRLSVVAQRVVLFSVTSRAIRVVTLFPLVVLVSILLEHRDESLKRILARRPVTLVVVTVAAITGLRYGAPLATALERIFFRERRDARRTLHTLSDRVRIATSIDELTAMISHEIDNALHLEAVGVFIRDPRTEAFVPPAGSSSFPLDPSSRIAIVAAQASEAFDLDFSSPRSPLRGAPEVDLQWTVSGPFALILPLPASDGSLLGLIALGEKRSELPFDREDRLLLRAVANSAALGLENFLLRSSPHASSAHAISVSSPDNALATVCATCSAVCAPGSLQCPADGSFVIGADVPYVLNGKLRLEQRIGAGGMGVVYRARDLSLSRMVAVKTLPRVSAEAAARLRREARAAAQFVHPNVATVHAIENWRSVPVIVYEYLDGGTLADRVRRAPCSEREVVEIGLAICSALESAHEAGILHRDIKPSNIGFTQMGRAKLLDFGLAKFLEHGHFITSDLHADGTEDVPQTRSSGIVGSPPYLAPEAILGERADPRFDLWSLAVTLYEAHSGRNPFLDVSAARTFNRILHAEPPDVREMRPDASAPLALFLRAALQRDPTQRPQSARAFASSLATMVV